MSYLATLLGIGFRLHCNLAPLAAKLGIVQEAEWGLATLRENMRAEMLKFHSYFASASRADRAPLVVARATALTTMPGVSTDGRISAGRDAALGYITYSGTPLRPKLASIAVISASRDVQSARNKTTW